MAHGRARRAARTCLRIAGVMGIIVGAGFGAFAIPAILSVGARRGIPMIGGFPAYGYGPMDAAGWPTTVPLLVAFLVACLVHTVGGILLLRRMTAGVVVTLVGTAGSAVFWWGFALPLAWIGAAIQLVLIAAGWTGRRSRDPDRG